MFIWWRLKRQNKLLAVLVLLFENSGWEKDHPRKGSSFLLLQRSLQVPRAKALLGIINQNPLKIILFYYSVFGFILEYFP